MTTNGHNGNGNGKMGRPTKDIDWKEFETLCHLQCTIGEMCEWFHMTDKTLQSKVKGHYSETFSLVFEKKRVGGKISLRRNLFHMSEKQPAVAIFLAKNWLGMADKQEIEVGNKDTIAELTDAELEELISRRRGGGASEEAIG